MRRGHRFIAVLTIFFAFMLALAAAPQGAFAAERRVITVPDADYAGHDARTLKNVDLKACSAACLADKTCRAFTFNQKHGLCFLKSDFGDLTAFKGAISGRVVATSRPGPTVEAQRRAELSFVPSYYMDQARGMAARLKTSHKPGNASYQQLRNAGENFLKAQNFPMAATSFGRALALAPESFDAWAKFALASVRWTPKQYPQITNVAHQAVRAAINAYLHSSTERERAQVLVLLAKAFEKRNAWRPAIRSYRASLALIEHAGVRETYDKVVAQHGFRILSHTVDSDAVSPRICIVMSEVLPTDQSSMSKFVVVEGHDKLAIEPQNNQVCIDGVEHGRRYKITMRSGLPSVDGEKLEKSVDLAIYVRDRSPWVGFAGKSYVLPRGEGASIPVVTVNTERVKAKIFRIGDRGLAGAVRDGLFLNDLNGRQAEKIADSAGEMVWEGEIEVRKELNKNVTSAIPIGDAVKILKPGVHVITARAGLKKPDFWTNRATQWFVVSDLGLTSLKGTDGVHMFVRSLSSAKPVAGAKLRLIASNDEVLGEVATDAAGYARFAPGLARGKGGMAPRLVVANTEEGDYAFVDLGQPSFDLTDRGVAGRPASAALDVYMTPERGIYRPGETIHLTALARDREANAQPKLPLTVVVERPDGVEFMRRTATSDSLGGYVYEIALRPNAMRGAWRLRLFADPKGKSVAETSVLVEDFSPEILAFDLTAPAERLDPEKSVQLSIDARYLYGAPAADLSIGGEVKIAPVTGSPKSQPGYRFGLADDPVSSSREPLAIDVRTDEKGKASVEAELPELPASTRLLEATFVTRLTDAGGRSIERSVTRPIVADGPRIGIRPLFKDDTIEEGGSAGFEVIVMAPDGARLAQDGIAWTLEKLNTSFQWYRSSGSWTYEPVTTTARISNGTLDVGAGEPAALSMPVKWGRYRLRLEMDGQKPTATSIEFDAGWHAATASAETPDFLEVALDKAAYRNGDTARLRIKPRFAGTALISVIDNKLIAMKAVEVGAEGTTVDLDVTEAWGPGAYVTAALYRPMDVAAKRMPARALGLQWLKVDPAGRKLAVTLDLAEEHRPRGALEIPVKVAGLEAGEEAYVTVAAVDVGILNMTRFKTPAPDDWYFGQRALGMEIRDLYGHLIDRMQGVPGRVRSGGDFDAKGLDAPPPTQKLLAFFSGIVRVDATGEARVSFDIPDFNGTVRVMAMAWSAQGVGHGAKDILVRDPVVVTASVPKFLAPDDRSRLYLDVTNVAGAAGDYTLSVATDQSVAIAPADATRTLSLAKDARMVIAMPIVAKAIGTALIEVSLTGPSGDELTQDLVLDVRATDQPVVRRSTVKLAALSGKLTLGADTVSGFVPGTASSTLSISNAGAFDIPGLLKGLDRYPYGCTEQLTSRALPLVYLDDVAATIGLAVDKTISKRVQEAIVSVLAYQSSSGGFGLWGPGSSDLWLDSYVTDFLIRAREKKYEINKVALEIALDNLSNRIAYSADFDSGGEAIAYALYVLARSGRAAIGDLHYYADVKLGAFSTPLAKAQIGAALALYGDTKRAANAFRAAVRLPETDGDKPKRGWRRDYGTAMRDEAAILTLAAETGQGGIDLANLADRIATRREGLNYTSTQEKVWLLLAANALAGKSADAEVAVNGTVHKGSYYRLFDEKQLKAASVAVENRSKAAIMASITTTGVPLKPEPAGGNGFAIERAYFTPAGKAIDIGTVAQNDRFVVVLTVTADERRSGRLLVVDPLPAGFEIENPNLTQSGRVKGYSWLAMSKGAAHTEARADRFVAAINRSSRDPAVLKVAYSVRAASPGNFMHPAATVEDMYRPAFRARTATGRIEVAGPLR